MLASGGQDTLCLWDFNQPTMPRHFKKPSHFHASKISGSVGGAVNKGLGIDSEFSQVSWSHDGLLLAAAIHNKLLVFDLRKLSSQPAAISQQSQK
jgi:hypothetical protein